MGGTLEGQFAGRRIVVTGSGRGLGYDYADRLASEGADVVLAEIDVGLGRAAEAELRGQGLSATFIETDVASEDSVEHLAAFARQWEGGIHGLVANAALANNVGGKSYDEIDVETWDRLMAVNVKGTWLTVRAIAPFMATGGSIVTVTSASAFSGSTRLLHYVTSKSAIIGMTRALARELAERSIRVNCLSPGLTVCEATKDIPEKRWQEYAEKRMLNRPQVPEDLEGVVSFLLSSASRYMTGQTVAVDGGVTLL